jgi:Na+/H+-dicarboxylate symporter
MMGVGKASSIGWTVIGLYLATTVMAAFFGCMSTLMFMNLYTTETFDTTSPPPYVTLGCSTDGAFVAETDNGSLMCSTEYAADDPNVNFIIDDISKTFVTASGGTVEVSLSDTIYQGIFQKIVPDNIIGAFNGSNFAAVIFFAILFGVALSRVVLHSKGSHSHLMGVLKESDNCFQLIVLWIIFLTPFAVCSLIASAIGKQTDLGLMFKNIGYLVAASMLGWGFQLIFVYIGLFTCLTRSNPFTYLKHIVPAQTMAFASASSAATIPNSIVAVMSSGKVPETIARFVIPFGATVNMDGGAVYFVTACIWLAVLNGETVTAASFIMLIIIATVGSIGTAPVPSASLVLIITAYNTVFGTTGTPNGFGYIFAIDWFMDRMRTVTNVTGDCVVGKESESTYRVSCTLFLILTLTDYILFCLLYLFQPGSSLTVAQSMKMLLKRPWDKEKRPRIKMAKDLKTPDPRTVAKTSLIKFQKSLRRLLLLQRNGLRINHLPSNRVQFPLPYYILSLLFILYFVLGVSNTILNFYFQIV